MSTGVEYQPMSTFSLVEYFIRITLASKQPNSDCFGSNVHLETLVSKTESSVVHYSSIYFIHVFGGKKASNYAYIEC
jgi:hypothetical protein